MAEVQHKLPEITVTPDANADLSLKDMLTGDAGSVEPFLRCGDGNGVLRKTRRLLQSNPLFTSRSTESIGDLGS